MAIVITGSGSQNEEKEDLHKLMTKRGHEQLVFKNIVPIVMAGVLSIYGMIIGVIIASGVNAKTGEVLYSDYSMFTGFAHRAAGITCGHACLTPAARATTHVRFPAGLRERSPSTAARPPGAGGVR